MQCAPLLEKGLVLLIRELQGSLFDLAEDCVLVHCISADYKLGAGIAVEFQRRFDLRVALESLGGHTYPACIRVDNVLNLVTKGAYWEKPTYDNLTSALQLAKQICIREDITKLAMPRVGCGLDRLAWSRVKSILAEVFDDAGIDIIVCRL